MAHLGRHTHSHAKVLRYYHSKVFLIHDDCEIGIEDNYGKFISSPWNGNERNQLGQALLNAFTMRHLTEILTRDVIQKKNLVARLQNLTDAIIQSNLYISHLMRS